MNSPTPAAQCANMLFKLNSLFGVLTIPGPGWKWRKPWHDLWNLLFINIKDKSFCSSIECSGLSSVYATIVGEIFQIYIIHITRKCICETHSTWDDLIINPPIKNTPPPPHEFPERGLCPKKSFFFKKDDLI